MSKADNLLFLLNAGFRVPALVIIPAEVFDRFRADLSAAPTAQSIRDALWSSTLAEEILMLARQLPAGPVAVRSSMAGEDSSKHSFAGQLDSFLNVCGDDDLLTAVKTCWASAYSERIHAYREQHGLATGILSMEVLIQVMVPAEVSGVIFTSDPMAHEPGWMVLSASKGLGEALMQGRVDGDTWKIESETGRVEGDGKILTKEQLLALTATAKKIETLFGLPQDIEFAIANGECFIVQARPITTSILNHTQDPKGERILWDNSNITESYSGVTTPLTYSVVREAYAQVYRQFLSIMGVHRIDEGFLRNLLGLYNGQVYYQLLNWYKTLAFLPAFEQNRRLLEQMMGVKQTAGKETNRRDGNWLTLGLWIVRMFYLHATNERRCQRFLDHFNSILGEYNVKDFNTLSPHQLHEVYLDLNRRVLGEWRAPILTDFFAMIFYGLLRRLSERWLDSTGSFHNDLMAGDGEIESLEPVRRILEMARQVRSDPQLQSAFSGDSSETFQRIQTKPEFAAFRAHVDAYLQLYGDRCMNELKLEEPNLRDDPARLIKLIAAAVDHPVELGHATSVRTRAEARLANLSFSRRLLFDWTLRYTRRHVRNRENMRFARTRLFGLVRRIVNALGSQWVKADALDHADDIYYLTIGEIWDFAEGTAVTQNLPGLTTLRRAEYKQYQGRFPPDRFETFGAPYLDQPHDSLAEGRNNNDILQGVGCCSGHVQGRARVVQSSDNVSDLGGDILVAERTDPGWVFLFPSASGILVERGSPLSHSAIMARELGKPTIVNIPGLTKHIHTGDIVLMDGEKGMVRVIKA